MKSPIWLHWERISELWKSRIRVGSNLHVFSSSPLIFLLAILECDVNRIHQVHMLQTCSLSTKQLPPRLCSFPALTAALFLTKLLANSSQSAFALPTSSASFHLPRPLSCHRMETGLAEGPREASICTNAGFGAGRLNFKSCLCHLLPV